jgi:OOP family OmpA-OmpF porin
MKTSFTKKQATLAAACALALSLTTFAVQAQTWGGTGTQVWKNGAGECWRSAYGTVAVGECNPAPLAQSVAPAPAPYVAPAPVAAPYVAPAPVVIAAAAPAVYERVTFDANVLFDFDNANLRPAGRDTLDAFVKKTRNLIDPGSMIAVGYADRVGTGGYNQTLSEARVASVKSYLVGQGIASNQVGTSGRGETQPTTRTECDGPASAKNIACLQPDRHVYIELTGSRLKQ